MRGDRERSSGIGQEIAHHLARLENHLMETEGLDRESARREARRRFGDPRVVEIQCDAISARPDRSVAHRSLAAFARDLRHSLRGFRRNPGFAAVAVVTLSLGVGVATAIFSVFNGVLLQPLPFADPEQLVELGESNPGDGVPRDGVSHSAFADWKERQTSFAGLAAWEWDTAVLAGDDGAMSLSIAVADHDLFDVLGVPPVVGRFFRPDDVLQGQSAPVAVIGFELWRDRFGADTGIVGSSIILDGIPRTVIGVMQPNSRAPQQDADLWLPVEHQRRIKWDRHSRVQTAYGRLKQGVSLEQALADMNLIAASLEEEFPYINEDWRVWGAPLSERVVGSARPTIVVAFAAVGLVLVIACVNIANLFLSRATGKRRELAVRVAVGASRSQIARQLLTESIALTVLGSAGGLVVAKQVLAGLVALQPGIIPRTGELAIDLGALFFALSIAIVTGVLFGLVPLRGVFSESIETSLHQGGARGHSAGRRDNRLGTILVTTQMALTLVLLSAGGLLAKSMWNLSRVNPGFDYDRTVIARLFLEPRRYDSDEALRAYLEDLLERVRAIPSVVSAGASTALPMDPLGINYDLPVRLQGSVLPDGELPAADYRIVSAGYFETLGTALVSGAFFSGNDQLSGPGEIIVNQTMARRFWEGEDPIGKHLETPSRDWNEFVVVGIVEDTKYYGPASDAEPEMYISLPFSPSGQFSVVVATSGDASALVGALRQAILEIDSNQPAHSVVTMASLVAGAVAAERFYAVILSVFAAVALALSVVGLYGVLSYWVNQRTKEIGVRMALGAERGQVLLLVVRRGFVIAGVGVAAGLMVSVALTRFLQSVLYSVTPNDPATLVVVSLILAAAAVAASFIPAWRATRLDPVATLRVD